MMRLIAWHCLLGMICSFDGEEVLQEVWMRFSGRYVSCVFSVGWVAGCGGCVWINKLTVL
jgi:hypothetical protein